MSIETLNGLTNFDLLYLAVVAEPSVVEAKPGVSAELPNGGLEPAAGSGPSTVDGATTSDQPFEELHVQTNRRGELLWLQASARHDQARCLVNALTLNYRDDDEDGAAFTFDFYAEVAPSKRIEGAVAPTANQFLSHYNGLVTSVEKNPSSGKEQVTASYAFPLDPVARMCFYF